MDKKNCFLFKNKDQPMENKIRVNMKGEIGKKDKNASTINMFLGKSIL